MTNKDKRAIAAIIKHYGSGSWVTLAERIAKYLASQDNDFNQVEFVKDCGCTYDSTVREIV